MSKIRIAEMLERTNISDTDLIIVEDEIDTKKATIKELKRAFSGDEFGPSNYRFYSSKKVNDLINSMNISMSVLPGREEFDNLAQQIKNIQQSSGSTGTEHAELVAARGAYGTLSERLAADQKDLEYKYMQFPTVKTSGMIADLSDYDNVKVNVVCPLYNKATTLYVKGKNKYAYGDTGYTNVAKVTATHGLKITYTKSQNAYNVPIGTVLPAGKYMFYVKAKFSSNFVKEGTLLKLIHSDNSVTVMDYDYSEITRFSVNKPIKAFQVLPRVSTIVDGMWVQLDNIMISDDESLNKFYPYCDTSYSVPANTLFTETFTLSRCILSRSEGTIMAKAIEVSYDGNKIKQDIESLKDRIFNTSDYCGLIENPGTYIYAQDHIVVNSPDQCIIENDIAKNRNGKQSAKITIMDYDNEDQPRFTLVLPNTLDLTDSKTISFQFYVDKTLSERFSEDDGIKIMLSSDSEIANPNINYLYFLIGKNSFVQGWNTIKLKISDFKKHGAPNIRNITQINFRIFTSEFTNGKSFWFNSVIIDQRIKPTILFAFDGFYDNAFDYQYPYLYTRNIPVTIFANDKQTLTKAYMEKIAKLHYAYGWELANYGCNPNKEIMLEDDNPREQYMAVKDTRQWIYDNFTSEVISYAAPFGNLRPISEPILKELGFKIAKADADAYCSFFSEQDFIIPMHLLSNAPGKGADKIKDKIDEIVDTGQVLCIYTNDVTKYGDEISATKVSFEAVISHIQKYIDRGELECMTFSDFYRKCVSR